MRIAQIAPLAESVPPKLYGGTERIVSFLTEELVALGCDVTLFASGDSKTRANLIPIWPRALRLDPEIRDPLAPLILELKEVADRASQFDVLHFHLEYLPLPFFDRLQTPSVMTLHGRLDLPELKPVFEACPNLPLVSISDAQRRPLTRVNFVRTVPHCIPEQLLVPVPATPRYFVFLGRISPEKGLDSAIRIARACSTPLKVAAKLDKVDEPYFRSAIEPMLSDGDVEMIGEVDDAHKPELLSGAIALLMPIRWPEPFGLVMIEAMACGTPVIAFNAGAVPEILEDGSTGFVVDNEAEAIRAVGRLGDLSRLAIRQRFEQRFTARRMAENYLDVYRQLAGQDARPAARKVESV